MHISRSTRLACSGLLSTSGIRLTATCRAALALSGHDEDLAVALIFVAVWQTGQAWIPGGYHELDKGSSTVRLHLFPC